MEKVAVVGAGMTKFGEHWDQSIRNLVAPAVDSALESVDNGINRKDIGVLFVSNVHGGQLNRQANIAALVADVSGFKQIPGVRTEVEGASGGEALRLAYNHVKSGMYETVMVVGVEKMTDITDGGELNRILASSLSHDYEAQLGMTLPAAHAIMANAHMSNFGTTREMLSAVVAKNHANAVNNPYAQYRRAFPAKVISGAPLIADPLTMFDCAPASDGASAIILSNEEQARKYTDTPVWISGSGIGGDSISLHNRNNLYSMSAVNRAAKDAFKMANLTPDDIKLAEVHDSYSIAELIQLEAVGFFEAGEAGPATLDGQTALNEKVSVNPSGGLKAQGYPMGAAGVAQSAEVWKQLRKEVDEQRQVDTEKGLTCSIAGTGSCAIVNIFEV